MAMEMLEVLALCCVQGGLNLSFRMQAQLLAAFKHNPIFHR